VSTNERLFRLEGEALDLTDLAESFSTGDRKIAVYDGTFCLSLPMPSDINGEDARSRAEDELSLMTGMAFVLFENHHPVRISGECVLDPITGKLRTSYSIEGSVSMRIRSRSVMTFVRADGTTSDPIENPQSNCGAILGLTAANDSLQRALFLYGKLAHSWRGLYMIVEAVEDGNGGEHGLTGKLWGDNEVKRFKATANSYNALGAEARHGTVSKSVATASIDLPAAKRMVHRLLKSWIEELRRS
jgi:hypothetical protein